MTVLVVTLFAQAGGRTSLLAARLADRSGRAIAVLAGSVLAQAILAAAAIRLGQWMATAFTPEAHGLILAVALVLTGLEMIARTPVADGVASRVRLGAFWGAAIGGGAIMLGESGLLVVAAAAARSPLPWAALPGAAVGLVGAILPAILLGEREWRRAPWRMIRLGLGAAMVLSGVVLGLSIRHLI
ncbi:TMEM165/GDT1 family protein [Sphingomonas sp. Leaf21]|uniref:TMEM165/GDT1 family protein n=1 Tax=Sphingomonas sp. Leaf21 TaxID=2876550 RepID=UPI001E48CA51|nr:TMEM165/GDT1 family protein [Sphingomonas sp. Leaf21]